MSTAPQHAPGWYQDPWDTSHWRWYDGAQWTAQTAPMPAPQATAPAVGLVQTPAQVQAQQLSAAAGSDPWRQPRYVISQKIVALGSRYELQLPTPATAGSHQPDPGQLIAFVQRKRVAIKERISFQDASEQELFALVAPKVLNLTSKYELRTPDGRAFAYLRKRVGASFWRTSWRLLDEQEREVAVAREASGMHAFLRRFGGMLPFGFVADLLPYNFTITAGADAPNAGDVLGSYVRRIGLRDRYDLDLGGDAAVTVDRRGVLALAIALDVLQNR